MPVAEVSVLLPVRDAQDTLEVALGTTLRSMGVHFEVVLIDHGSVDDSRRIATRIAEKDSRVRIVDAPFDLHFSEALEVGRAQCRAPFIARMDADDLMHPRRLAADVAHLKRHSSTVAVASRTKLVPKGAAGRGMHAYVAWQNQVLSASDHARELWIEQPVCHPATTFVAESLRAIGGYRAIHGPEDYDLFLRLQAQGDLEKRPDIHHAWREHRGRTTWTSGRHHRDAFAALKAEALVERFSLRTRPLLIAGAGKEGGRIGKALAQLGVRTEAYVDVADRRIGSVRHGAPIFSVDELPRLRAQTPNAFGVGAVGTSGARGAVRESLRRAGFTLGENAVIVC